MAILRPNGNFLPAAAGRRHDQQPARDSLSGGPRHMPTERRRPTRPRPRGIPPEHSVGKGAVEVASRLERDSDRPGQRARSTLGAIVRIFGGWNYGGLGSTGDFRQVVPRGVRRASPSRGAAARAAPAPARGDGTDKNTTLLPLPFARA